MTADMEGMRNEETMPSIANPDAYTTSSSGQKRHNSTCVQHDSLSLQSWHTCLLLTSLEEGDFPGVC